MMAWLSGITAHSLPVLDRTCIKFGQRGLDFQLRIAPLCSLKWNSMTHEGKVKVATHDRLVGVEAGAA